MTTFTAYFDESYTHPPAPLVYTIAGYVSTNYQWRKFRKEWRTILDQEGLTHFHMVDFQACKQPYGAWPKQKRIKFLQALHKTIHKRTVRSFTTSVNLSDYELLTEQEKYFFGSPHVQATIHCMKLIAKWADNEKIKEPMPYVFESGSAHDKELRRLFDDTMDEGEKAAYRCASISFADKKDIEMLQAADVLAYEITKEYSRQLTPNNTRPVRESIKNLSLPRLDDWTYFGRKEFLEALGHMERLRLISPPIDIIHNR